MNCYRCGEESEPAGHICKPCLDEVMEKEALKRQEKEKVELSPSEAIIAMINGETLVMGDHPVEERWNGNNFVYRIIGNDEWHLKPMDGLFKNLFHKPKTRPMDTFECLAWVSSPESQDWMVSIKHKDDKDWSHWDIP